MILSRDSLRRLVLLALFIIILGLFSLANPYFLTLNNMVSISREAAFIGIIAVGASFVIITGGIDISVGSSMAFTAMVCSNILRFTTLSIAFAVAAALLAGAACGLFNGLVITKLHIPDFIVVLATMGMFRGFTMMLAATDIASMTNNPMIANPNFKLLGGRVGSVYYVFIVFILLAAAGQYVLHRTKLGLYTFAVGSNIQSARLSGIRTDNIKIFAYALTGLLAGVSGVFTASRLMTATVETGLGMEFNVIAAVVIGGTSLSGGSGDIVGTLIGTLMMSVINSGTVQAGIPTFYQPIIKGAIILSAVMFDMWNSGRLVKLAKKAGAA